MSSRPERVRKRNRHSKGGTVLAIYEKYNGICQICLQPVDKSLYKTNSPDAPSRDHIIPASYPNTSRGIHNLQLAHVRCNNKKANRILNNVEVL